MRSSLAAAVLLSGLSLLAGCSQPPAQDIAAVTSALEDAKRAQAPDYAPEAWAEALKAQDRMNTELEAQKVRLAVVRSYGDAAQLARAAQAAAVGAKAAAETGKEKAKNDTSAKINEARTAFASLQQALAAAPRGKGSEADLTSLKSDAGSVEATLQQMQTAFDAGNYLEARASAESAISTCQNLEAEIKRAAKARRAVHHA